MAKRAQVLENKLETPPMSRLFVICSKVNTEEEFEEEFSKFGNLEEVFMVKDRVTGEKKGVCYIKYSKTSEAAAALETMNGKVLGSSERPIKVLVASSKNHSTKRNDDDTERYLRLFVIIPRDKTETQLYEEFGLYGKVENISIVRDRQTKEGKGFAYIKFQKFSDIANAFENCDSSYKAVFAEPKPPKNENFNLNFETIGEVRGSSYSRGGIGSLDDPRRMSDDFGMSMSNIKTTALQENGTLTVICSPLLREEHIWKLFDIIPGLENCRIQEDYLGRTINATVTYNNIKSAMYAKAKLNNFEFPPGERLIVKCHIIDSQNMASLGEQVFNFGGTATSSTRDSFCNISLPPQRPLVPSATCKKRLFIVCRQALPYNILKQAFCRFGDLIEVFLLPAKTCGYALYASESAANDAIHTLHGAEICGVRMKVMPAEEPPENNRKRLRPDDSN